MRGKTFYAVRVRLQIVGLLDQRHLLKENRKPFRWISLIEPGDRAHQFFDVLQPAFRFNRVRLLELFHVARLIQYSSGQLEYRVTVLLLVQRAKHLAEPGNSWRRKAPELSPQILTVCKLVNAGVVFRQDLKKPGETFLPDSPCGRVDYSLQADRVPGILNQLEVREYVLDLFPLVKPESPDDLVRNRELGENLLEYPRESVRAIQYCEIGVAQVECFTERLDCLGNENSFRLIVSVVLESDQLAAVPIRPQIFLMTFRVVLNDRVRRIENDRGRAVVFLQPDYTRTGKIILEIQYVFRVRATESIDRLIVVSNDADIFIPFRQGHRKHVLRFIYVLVLIDKNVLVAVLKMAQRFRAVLHKLDRFHYQVVEIERLIADQTRLISLVNLTDQLLPAVVCHLLIFPPVDKITFRTGDRTCHRFGFVMFDIDLEILHRAFDQND